ncbi:unnamed protein product, partial [Ascophyllum nodosum]
MCTGDSDANCGGYYAMRIFTRDDSTEEPPSPVPSPVPSGNPMPVSSPTPVMTIPDECTGIKAS